jgi:hypothetical protein
MAVVAAAVNGTFACPKNAVVPARLALILFLCTQHSNELNGERMKSTKSKINWERKSNLHCEGSDERRSIKTTKRHTHLVITLTLPIGKAGRVPPFGLDLGKVNPPLGVWAPTALSSGAVPELAQPPLIAIWWWD